MTARQNRFSVGIPRTFLYFSFFPLWRRFFEELGAQVVTSSPSSRRILDSGVTAAVADACIPLKLMHGHILDLVAKDVDFLFLPRVICTNGRTVYCPKFLGLTDMIRSSIGGLPPLIDVRYDARRGRDEARRAALEAGQAFTDDERRVLAALDAGREELRRYNRLLAGGLDPEAAIVALRRDRDGAEGVVRQAGPGEPRARATCPGPAGGGVPTGRLRLGVVGYPYVVHDPFINLNLHARLRALGIEVLTAETLSLRDLAPHRRELGKDLFWTYSEEAVGAGFHYFEHPELADGVVHVTAFGCGPDSVADKLLEIRAQELGDRPFISLMIDEHTGEAGMLTRLEAFTEMIRRRKAGAGAGAGAGGGRAVGRAGGVDAGCGGGTGGDARADAGCGGATAVTGDAGTPAAAGTGPAGAPAVPDARRRRGRFVRRRRRVTFPYLGTLPEVFAELFETLGNEVVMPQRPSRRTLNLGTAHAPEFACIPLKILLGTYLEALEAGADTIVSSGGVGPCRAGLYTEVHEWILRRMGASVDVITLEPPRVDLREFLSRVSALNPAGLPVWRIAYEVWRVWRKMIALDDLERLSHRTRARELVRGTTTPVFREAVAGVHKAGSGREIEAARLRGREMLEAVPKKPGFVPLKVGIVGEIYVLVEPAANFEIEETLGELGVETERAIYMGGWAGESNLLGKPGTGKNETAQEAAQPYLAEMIGGHGQGSVGHAVLYARAGFDGVIQLAPFTCIPEIVAKSVLERVSAELDIPLLSISFDEQTGKAGLMTRLEAFTDLLWRRRRLRKEEAGRAGLATVAAGAAGSAAAAAGAAGAAAAGAAAGGPEQVAGATTRQGSGQAAAEDGLRRSAAEDGSGGQP